MNKVYLLTGSNAGKRSENLMAAKHLIINKTGSVLLESHIYETEPWGYKSNAYFFNQCLLTESDMEAENILNEIQDIERKMGRKSQGKKIIDRIIDIDILFFNHDCYKTNNLTIPHPRLHERRFVLIPLCEIAPDYIHPVFGCSIDQLLSKCKDTLIVRRADY